MGGEVGCCLGMPMPGAPQHLRWGCWGTGGGLAHSLLVLEGLCCACSSFFFHYFLFFKSLFSTCFFTSQQGQDMGFTTLQAPAMLL